MKEHMFYKLTHLKADWLPEWWNDFIDDIRYKYFFETWFE